MRCINLAKDGIHSVLLVFSVRTRFSEEEEAALHSLQTLFGSKIIDYMTVVFTGGDELEDNDETLEDYLGRDCPKPLKVMLEFKYHLIPLFLFNHWFFYSVFGFVNFKTLESSASVGLV